MIQALLVVLLVTLAVFLLMHLMPGDPILMYLTQSDMDVASPAQIAALRHHYGLDRPIVVQYFAWVVNAARGDFGVSVFTGDPVMAEIARALPITIYISLIAWLIAHIIGLVGGVVCAVRRGKWQDTAITSTANVAIAVPEFWLGILLIYWLGYKFRLFPIQGFVSPFEDPVRSLRLIAMPVFCLAFTHIAGTLRQTRSAMLEVIRQDYIRTAWSKGLSERGVIFKHALKNGILPVVTLSGMSIRAIFGGTVFIENVFNIPGMGRLAVGALFSKDYAVVQANVLIIAMVVVFSNLLVDISYGWLDPRIRYR